MGLEDAVIRQERKDSVWNFQFIIDYFSSPTQTEKKKSGKGLQLNLQKLDLKNVSFLTHDDWVGEQMLVSVGSLLLDADSVDFSKNIYKINQIEIDKPLFSQQHYDGLRPPKDTTVPAVADTGMYFNPGDIQLFVKNINITNGGLFIGKRDGVPDPHFDGSHIQVSNIAGSLKQVDVTKDTIKAIVSLSAKERSGFDLKSLKAHFRFTPQIMEFSRLDIRTNKSRLGDYYAMKFDDFNKDMGEYIDQVIMEARFKNAEIHSDDIAFFAPELKSWNKAADISGRFLGTVADFKVANLFVRSGNETYLAGNLSMKGLPYMAKTRISLTNANLQATYHDASILLPAIKNINSPNLPSLGKVRFAGNFTGTIYDFSANGNISTAIGGAYANINLKLPKRGEPAYKGTLITKQFNLGKFLEVDAIGLVGFKGAVAGSSFNINRIKTSVDGSFDQFQFHDYSYSDLLFNGTIQNKYFTGEFKANDTNFVFTSNVVIDLKEEQPKFNILGDLVKANFKKLNFSKENFELAGLFDLDFEGKNIDEFVGYAKILNASLKHDSTKLSFDSLSVASYKDSVNRKVLDIRSNEFDVMVRGQYNILGLPTSFQSFLSNYFPSYISKPQKTPENQGFLITVHTRDFDKYARILDPKLSGFDNATITGGVNTKDSGIFYLKTEIPNLKYDNYKIENADIQGRGDFRSVTLSGDIDKIFISDSTFFPNTQIGIRSENDHSDVHISTSANNTLNDAELNADVYTLPDGVRINFQPSSFVINDKKWNLEKQGEIIIRKNLASAQNVKFTQGFQAITVETEMEEGSNVSDLVVKLKDVNIGDFTPMLTKEPRMEGVANGDIYLRDFFGQFRVESALKTEQFRLDNDSIGLVTLNGSFDSKTGLIRYNAHSDNENYQFSADGNYETKDSTGSPLNTNLHLSKTKIRVVNRFLGSLFENIDGFTSGDLTIKGDPSAPQLLGTLSVSNVALTVKYTRVRYIIDSAVFKFKEGVIDFGQFNISDENNNKGTVKGKLYQQGFKNMQFDFDLSTNKLLLLNTSYKDNQQFYGRAIGKASLSLKGPEENMRLSITGEVNDTTHIFIPTSGSRESTDADYIVFKEYGVEMEEPGGTEKANLDIDLDITANNKAQIDVILDPFSGDVIKATGNGRMQIKVPAHGSMSMKGRYNIERGRYDFNFQSFIKKPFDFMPDAGNYIEWNGDPYNANLHIDAQYTASRVSLNDLVGSQSQTGINSTVKGYRGDVYVVAELRGKLTKPNIDFRLDFPPNSAIKNDNDFALFLNRLQSDDNEMLKQVTYLIVFGSFAPYGEARTGTNVTSIGLNTISQKLTAELNKLVSNLLFKITGDKSLQLDVATSTYSSASLIGNGVGISSNKLDRQTVNLKVNQSLLDGKIIVTFGGDLDFNLSNSAATQAGNFQWLPDISVQIVLTKDRKLRAVIFNKSSLNVNSNAAIGRQNRQGVSISYTRDFEKLFGDRPKDTIKIPPPQNSVEK